MGWTFNIKIITFSVSNHRRPITKLHLHFRIMLFEAREPTHHLVNPHLRRLHGLFEKGKSFDKTISPKGVHKKLQIWFWDIPSLGDKLLWKELGQFFRPIVGTSSWIKSLWPTHNFKQHGVRLHRKFTTKNAERETWDIPLFQIHISRKSIKPIPPL